MLKKKKKKKKEEKSRVGKICWAYDVCVLVSPRFCESVPRRELVLDLSLHWKPRICFDEHNMRFEQRAGTEFWEKGMTNITM